jgi:lambda repressor-like predicted transcriptional regulator
MASTAKINWQAAREAVALGASLRHVSETYGMTYDSLKQRIHRERWPKPEQLSTAHLPSPLVTAAKSWAEKGEAHRSQIFAMAQRALSAIADTPPDLTNWADIERAARLADRAAGLEQSAPVVSLTFPTTNSTELPGFLDISTKIQPYTPP